MVQDSLALQLLGQECHLRTEPDWLLARHAEEEWKPRPPRPERDHNYGAFHLFLPDLQENSGYQVDRGKAYTAHPHHDWLKASIAVAPGHRNRLNHIGSLWFRGDANRSI